MAGKIIIDTEYPISISTDRPVSITSEGGTTTLRIEGTAAVPEGSGLARIPRPPNPAEALLPVTTSRMKGPRCGVIMKRSKQPCARIKDHKGVHMNAQQVKNKQDYNKGKARKRYHDDEEYREAVKAASRDSHARKTGGADTE